MGCVTNSPAFMYSNTANRSPFSGGPFIVASTCSPVERVKIPGHPGSKRDDCMMTWCKKGGYGAQIPKNQSYVGSIGQMCRGLYVTGNLSPNAWLMWLHCIWY